MSVRNRTEIETYSGALVDFTDPQPEQIRLTDIAHALARTCRFGGHTQRFYSVAEHALFVRDLVIEGGRPDLALAALHHDSHEAYLGDIPTPLKRMLGPKVTEIAGRIDLVIAEVVGVRAIDFHRPEIVEADALALRVEAGHLKHSRGLTTAWGRQGGTPPGHKRYGDYDQRGFEGDGQDWLAGEFIAAHYAALQAEAA